MDQQDKKPFEAYLLDTETAGFSGGVCEFAYLKVDYQLNILKEFRTLVNPERPIEEGAQKIHGISDADVEDCQTLAQIAAVEFNGPIYMVAHNASFDKRMISPTIDVEASFCTLQLARRLITNTSSHKLEVLQSELNLPKQTSHSALGDVHTVRDLLLYVQDTYGQSFETLIARNNVPKVIHKMPFGKHKGKVLNRIGHSDRIWMLENMDLDRDLRYSLELLKDVR